MSEHLGHKGLVFGAALGLGAGLLANLTRKLAVQAPTALAGEWHEALAKEHAATLLILEKIEKTRSSDVAKRTLLLTQLKHALGKHAFQEENSVYPALREHGLLQSEEELTSEHAEVKFFLHRLTTLERSHPEWLPTVRELHAALEAHMEDEENNVFPQLHSKLSEEENAALTRSMNREGLKLA